MKILIGSSSPPDKGSGINAYTKELTIALLEQGHSIFYLSPTPKNSTWFDELKITHIPSEIHEDQILSASNLIKVINQEQFEGAINNDNSLLQSIAPALTCPLIVIGHFNKFAIGALACYRTEWTDYVIAISNDMHKHFVQKYNVPITKCLIIHNGINDANLGLHKGDEPKLKVIYAGAFNRIKGADKIVKLLNMYDSDSTNIEFQIFSNFPEKIKATFSNKHFIKFYGHMPRDEFLKQFHSGDVLLLPSRIEGCPMTMLEAMSYRMITVTSDGIGAMRWLIESGRSGYICYQKNWHKQAYEILDFLAAKPEIKKEIQSAAREKYLQQFQMKYVAENIINLIKKPTVDRSTPTIKFRVLKWHRPIKPGGGKANLIDRIFYRLGILKQEGWYVENDAV